MVAQREGSGVIPGQSVCEVGWSSSGLKNAVWAGRGERGAARAEPDAPLLTAGLQRSVARCETEHCGGGGVHYRRHEEEQLQSTGE